MYIYIYTYTATYNLGSLTKQSVQKVNDSYEVYGGPTRPRNRC